MKAHPSKQNHIRIKKYLHSSVTFKNYSANNDSKVEYGIIINIIQNVIVIKVRADLALKQKQEVKI